MIINWLLNFQCRAQTSFPINLKGKLVQHWNYKVICSITSRIVYWNREGFLKARE
jgi:hypothetical protein